MGGVESGVSTQCVWFALHLLARPNSHMYMDNHCVRLSFKLLLCRLYNMYILPRRLKYKISSLVDFSRNQISYQHLNIWIFCLFMKDFTLLIGSLRSAFPISWCQLILLIFLGSNIDILTHQRHHHEWSFGRLFFFFFSKSAGSVS